MRIADIKLNKRRRLPQLGGQPLTLGAIDVPNDDFRSLLDEQPGMRRAHPHRTPSDRGNLIPQP